MAAMLSRLTPTMRAPSLPFSTTNQSQSEAQTSRNEENNAKENEEGAESDQKSEKFDPGKMCAVYYRNYLFLVYYMYGDLLMYRENII